MLLFSKRINPRQAPHLLFNMCVAPRVTPTGRSLNIVFFPYFLNFLSRASSAAALVFYLPGVCTQTDTEGKQRKARIRNISKSLKEKHNI